MDMYEARQNKERQNRTIEKCIKTKSCNRNKDKRCISNTYINQMYKDTDFLARFTAFDINHEDEPVGFIERLDFLINISDQLIENDIPSFYGIYFSRMGPHTIAHSSLKETIANLSKENIQEQFSQLIQTPDQIQMILANEAIFYPVSSFNDNAGLKSDRLNSYVNMYDELYERCSDIVYFFQENVAQIKYIENNSFSDENADNASKIAQLWKFLQNNMVHLLNLNPYATYAWHRQDGCTKEEISGKGEVPCNLFDITDENDLEVNLSKFFDNLSLQSMTFNDINGFIEYIHLFFPKIPEQRIEELLYQSYGIPPQSDAITITGEEIKNYFNDMCEGNYPFYLKKIATISIIKYVDINLFAEKMLETLEPPRTLDYSPIMNVLETILVIVSDANSVDKVSQLISILLNDNDKLFVAKLSELLLDTNFEQLLE